MKIELTRKAKSVLARRIQGSGGFARFHQTLANSLVNGCLDVDEEDIEDLWRYAYEKAYVKQLQPLLDCIPGAQILGLFSEIQIIDPYTFSGFLDEESAEYILDNLNPNNRGISNVHVEYLMREMREGRWADALSDKMIFDDEAQLVEGQHRCEAVRRVGVGVRVLVGVCWA